MVKYIRLDGGYIEVETKVGVKTNVFDTSSITFQTLFIRPEQYNTPTAYQQRGKTFLNIVCPGYDIKPSLPNRLELQNTATASLQKSMTPATTVQDMTLNNLMVRLQ